MKTIQFTAPANALAAYTLPMDLRNFCAMTGIFAKEWPGCVLHAPPGSRWQFIVPAPVPGEEGGAAGTGGEGPTGEAPKFFSGTPDPAAGAAEPTGLTPRSTDGPMREALKRLFLARHDEETRDHELIRIIDDLEMVWLSEPIRSARSADPETVPTDCHTAFWEWLPQEAKYMMDHPTKGRSFDLIKAAFSYAWGKANLNLEHQIRELKTDAAAWRKKFLTQRDESTGNTWVWMGDGEDHLESLACPILIGPDDLRTIMDELSAYRNALCQLVIAKTEKEQHGKTPVYETIQRGAWEAARQAVDHWGMVPPEFTPYWKGAARAIDMTPVESDDIRFAIPCPKCQGLCGIFDHTGVLCTDCMISFDSDLPEDWEEAKKSTDPVHIAWIEKITAAGWTPAKFEKTQREKAGAVPMPLNPPPPAPAPSGDWDIPTPPPPKRRRKSRETPPSADQ